MNAPYVIHQDWENAETEFDPWIDWHVEYVARDLAKPIQELLILRKQTDGPVREALDKLNKLCAEKWRDQ